MYGLCNGLQLGLQLIKEPQQQVRELVASADNAARQRDAEGKGRESDPTLHRAEDFSHIPGKVRSLHPANTPHEGWI